MIKGPLYTTLRDALQREGHRHRELCDAALLTTSSLDDLKEKPDEWYAVIPLYKLRFLCSLINVNFSAILSIPEPKPEFLKMWADAIGANQALVGNGLYMTATFLEFLAKDVDVLNLY